MTNRAARVRNQGRSGKATVHHVSGKPRETEQLYIQ